MAAPRLRVVRGDITTLSVDAVVNAANNAMRGGGGVDGAIHRAGGPAVLADCIARFPNGLATGDAGWTTAGNLSVEWVIHTVGPNHGAGETDRALLTSCYRRCMEVADEVGATSIAFPLISAGVYGWPKQDAVAAAVDTVAATPTEVEQVIFVAFDDHTHELIRAQLGSAAPLRILQAVHVLHQRGHEQVRVLPGLSPSGVWWRATLSTASSPHDAALRYSSSANGEFVGLTITPTTTPEEVADAILATRPSLTSEWADPAYAEWYRSLMGVAEEQGALPIAYSDDDEVVDGWRVGDVVHPLPPG